MLLSSFSLSSVFSIMLKRSSIEALKRSSKLNLGSAEGSELVLIIRHRERIVGNSFVSESRPIKITDSPGGSSRVLSKAFWASGLI